MRRVNRLDDSLRGDCGFLGTLDFGKQHYELISALPAYGIRAAEAIPEARGDGLEQPVADRMSERIVDVLESVEIEKQHRDAGLMSQRCRDRLAYAVVEENSIGQTSEEIVLSRIRHLPRH